MNDNKRGLGRGLDALLATSAKAASDKQSDGVQETPLRQISIDRLSVSAYQPRKEMAADALEELAESIRAQGIIQPLIVRELISGDYEIIAGERRFRAAKLAGLEKVPCLVRKLDDQAASAIALIENIQREDLNVMEEAQAIAGLIDEFSLTHQQVAKALGKSRATVSNLFRLNGLHPSVKKMLFSRELEMGHARALLSLDEKAQQEAAAISVERHYTVRQTEALVKKMLSPSVVEKTPVDTFSALENRLSDKLGAQVSVSQKKNGQGRLVICFEESEKLTQILALFGEAAPKN